MAGDGGRSQNCAPYMGSGSGWLAGDWPSTGGILNITAAFCILEPVNNLQTVGKYPLIMLKIDYSERKKNIPLTNSLGL